MNILAQIFFYAVLKLIKIINYIIIQIAIMLFQLTFAIFALKYMYIDIIGLRFYMSDI